MKLQGRMKMNQYNDRVNSKVNQIHIKSQKQQSFKCPGIYCDQAKDNIFFDENDELFCLFIVADERNDDQMIPYKSIFLDLVERFKTLHIIEECCPTLKVTKQTKNKVENTLENVLSRNIPENILFRLRKFYSIGNITSSPLFKHLKVSNFYDQQRVCNYCSHVYNKIDTIRNEVKQIYKKQCLLKNKRINHDNAYIQREVEKYLQTAVSTPTKITLKNRMSANFYLKLLEFDVEKQTFQKEFIVTTSIDEKYFDKKQVRGQKPLFSLTQSQDPQTFQLPVIMKYTLRDKENLIKKKAYFVKKDQAESLGLKHFLGHVKNLPYSDQGLAISKSSLELNKLQDKIKDIELLKERLEQERITKIREEIELVMCTYYGKGRVSRDRLVDFVETLKRRDIVNNQSDQPSEIKAPKFIQIVTDKNDFLSENQRKQKQDNEKKEIEILESKKNFMELNSSLAQSIMRKRLQIDSPRLDQISEDSEIL